jgi:hypothetical protein
MLNLALYRAFAIGTTHRGVVVAFHVIFDGILVGNQLSVIRLRVGFAAYRERSKATSGGFT